MLEISYPGGREFTVSWTKWGEGQQRFTVRDDTLPAAKRKAIEWAAENGWTPPRWWQFWRWDDNCWGESLPAEQERT